MAFSLYKHQAEALGRMKNGCILHGGVGSGKSRTGLAYFYSKVCGGYVPVDGQGEWKEPQKTIPLYIITTARKREDLSWLGECSDFGLSNDVKNSVMNIPVVVDSWNCIKKYVGVKDAFFIFDEQRVVGNGAWVKSFLKIAKANQWILLSATPGDKWLDYVPVFLANGFYRNRTEFLQEHVIFNRFAKFPKVDRYVQTGKLQRLRKEVLVPMYYRKRTESHDVKITVGYDQEVYSNIKKIRWNVYKNQPCRDASDLCYTLRRVVNESPQRLEALLELLKTHERVIIFYNFNYELELLKDACEAIDLYYGEWNGHQHDLLPFGERWAYLVQYTAGAEGWNCTKTDTIIFYSQNYSYKITKQAAGRIDRLNTPYNDLYYFYLVSDAEIDKGISRSLKKKQTFNESAFIGDWDEAGKKAE